jgi:hypothetical protein
MQQRRRFKQKQSLEAQLARYAKTARKVAALLPPGAEKDELLRKARQADTAAQLNAAIVVIHFDQRDQLRRQPPK